MSEFVGPDGWMSAEHVRNCLMEAKERLATVEAGLIEKKIAEDAIPGIAPQLQTLEAHLASIRQMAGTPATFVDKAEMADEDADLMKKFLRLWRDPQGVMEPEIRDLVAKALGVEPPKME